MPTPPHLVIGHLSKTPPGSSGTDWPPQRARWGGGARLPGGIQPLQKKASAPPHCNSLPVTMEVIGIFLINGRAS